MRSMSIIIFTLVFSCCKLSASDTLIIKFSAKDARQTITTVSGRSQGNSNKSIRQPERVYVLAANVSESDTSAKFISYKILFNTKIQNQEGPAISKACFDNYSSIRLSDIKTIGDFEYLRTVMYKKTVLLVDETQSGKIRKAITVYPMFLEPIGNAKITF